MDTVKDQVREIKDRKYSTSKLRSMEVWENIQALTGNLMAAEDLSVVFDANIKHPAHIDLRRRIVRVARLVAEQKHLIPGLIFHEISHALYTKGNEPIDPVLNIIEDGYIERMGCKKYPGGKKHLRVIFDEFFDPKSKHFYQGSLVIRALNALNYNCKGIKFGKLVPYPSDLPKHIVKFFQDEVELCNLPTLKKRNELAKKVKKLLKPYRASNNDFNKLMNQSLPNNDPGKEQEPSMPPIDWDDDDDDKDKSSGNEDPNDDPMNRPDKKNKDEEKSEGEGDEENKDGKGEGKSEEKKDGEDGKDKDEENKLGGKGRGTNEANEEDWDPTDEDDYKDDDDDDDWLMEHLADENNGEIMDHHKRFDTIGSKNSALKIEIASPEAVSDCANIVDILDIKYPRFDAIETKRVNRNYTRDIMAAKKVAQIMYQKFLITKNAHDMRKTSYQRTGALDINRLAQYKTNDDIFITRTIQPKGKNHAIAIILDWSGSMSNQSMQLWQRTAEYVEFSRLADVRVVVYTFTTSSSSNPTNKNKLVKYGPMGIIHGNYIKLVDTAEGSNMENQKRLKRFWLLALTQGGGSGRGVASIVRGKIKRLKGKFRMGGTNIVEGHAFASYLALQLKKTVEKVSLVLVCDGGDSHVWDDWVTDDPDTLIYIDDNNQEQKINSSTGYDGIKYEMVLHGKPLPEPSQRIKDAAANSGRYNYTNLIGERQRALLGQTRMMRELGIKSTGIYLGSISKDIFPVMAMPYEGNLIQWTDLGKGNSFINILINQIS